MKRTFVHSCLMLIMAPGVLLLACGGKSGTSFDPERADELTQAALISTTDLPGAGWRIIEGDAPQGDGLEQVTDGSCNDVKAFVADTRKGIAGRAERALERPTFVTLFGVVVTVEVTAYNDPKGLTKLLRRYRRLASDGTLAGCLAKLSERTLSLRALRASSTAPHGGVAFADVRRFTALSGPPLTRVDERYLWVDGNVAVLVTISSPQDRFTSDVVKAALEKTDAAVTRAGKVK